MLMRSAPDGTRSGELIVERIVARLRRRLPLRIIRLRRDASHCPEATFRIRDVPDVGSKVVLIRAASWPFAFPNGLMVGGPLDERMEIRPNVACGLQSA